MTKLSGTDAKSTLYCSFCGKSQHEVRKLIAGPTVFICDECVDLCNDIIREETKTDARQQERMAACRRPAEICKVLDDYVIGQMRRQALCFRYAVHNHYKRLNHGAKGSDVELAKSNNPADGANRLRQDFARADARADSRRAVHDGRCDDADRSRLCRRGCREYHPQAAPGVGL